MRFGGLTAVGDLDLEVAEGSIHSIIGPNGAGKTTVFNCITQNLRPTDGGGAGSRRPRIDGLTPGPRRRGGHQPHLSEHPAVPQHHRDREPAGRDASASALHLVGRRAEHPAHHAPTKRARMRKRCDCCSSSACAAVATCWRAISPMASSAGWRSAARWRPSRRLLLLDEPTAGMNPRETIRHDGVHRGRCARDSASPSC